jgi:anti-anti-sigma regulatory factor
MATKPSSDVVETRMKLSYTETPEKIIAFLSEFDNSELGEIDASIRELFKLAKASGRRLVIDLRNVGSLNSHVLGWLIVIIKIGKHELVDLRFTNIGGAVMEVLRITQINTRFLLDAAL